MRAIFIILPKLEARYPISFCRGKSTVTSRRQEFDEALLDLTNEKTNKYFKTNDIVNFLVYSALGKNNNLRNQTF